MLSNLLVMLAPVGGKLARLALNKLANEAQTKTLPAKLEPHAELISEVCGVLLSLMDAAPAKGDAKPEPPEPKLQIAEGTAQAA